MRHACRLQQGVADLWHFWCRPECCNGMRHVQLRKLLHGTDRPGYLVSALPLPADWSQVWQAAMEEAELPTVLRRALDDSHMPVVTAAAEAIAATLCPTEAEMAVLTFAQACPASGGCALAVDDSCIS